MKKAILVAAVVLFISWSNGAFAFMGEKKLNIPELTAAPAIDGDGSDAAWSGAAAFNMTDQMTGLLPTPSQADTFVTVSAGWKGQSIFFKFAITDDSFDNSAWGQLANNNWMTDSIEILLDLNDLQTNLASDGAGLMAAFDATGGPCQIRAAIWDEDPFYNLVAFSNIAAAEQASFSGTAVPSSLANRWVAAHTISGTTAIQEIELKISNAALTAAGAASLADIDSFGIVLDYNDSDASGAPAPAGGGSAGTGTRDAQVIWWGGASNAPAGGVVAYNTAQTGSFWSTSAGGIYAEAGFVGAGEGGLVDRNVTPPPSFMELVDLNALKTTLEGFAGSEAVLIGLPTTIPDSVMICWMTTVMTGNTLTPYMNETRSAFAHNAQVLIDASGLPVAAVAGDVSTLATLLAITAGDPFTSALMPALQGMGLSVTVDDFETAPYYTDSADYDDDGTANGAEYISGDPLGFILSQLPKLPVSGLAGLLLLITGCGLGGALKARRK